MPVSLGSQYAPSSAAPRDGTKLSCPAPYTHCTHSLHMRTSGSAGTEAVSKSSCLARSAASRFLQTESPADWAACRQQHAGSAPLFNIYRIAAVGDGGGLGDCWLHRRTILVITVTVKTFVAKVSNPRLLLIPVRGCTHCGSTHCGQAATSKRNVRQRGRQRVAAKCGSKAGR